VKHGHEQHIKIIWEMTDNTINWPEIFNRDIAASFRQEQTPLASIR
jgi:hypothetical protein